MERGDFLKSPFCFNKNHKRILSKNWKLLLSDFIIKYYYVNIFIR